MTQPQPGTIVYYHLLPKDIPVKPFKQWSGIVILQHNDYLLVESLEPNYKGLTEIIHVSQVTNTKEIQELCMHNNEPTLHP